MTFNCLENCNIKWRNHFHELAANVLVIVLLKGLFGLNALKSAKGFYLMREQAVLEAQDLLAEGCSPDRTRKMVEVSIALPW